MFHSENNFILQYKSVFSEMDIFGGLDIEVPSCVFSTSVLKKTIIYYYSLQENLTILAPDSESEDD